MSHINDHLTAVSPETQRLGNAIVACAADSKIHPSKLLWGFFKRWLAEKHNIGAEQLADIDAHLKKVGGFATVRDSLFGGAPRENAAEQAEMKGLARITRNANNILATQDLFERRLEELFSKMLAKNATFKPFGYSVKPTKEPTGRVVQVALSDLHFGTDLDPREVKYRFGFKEEARRLASVIYRTCGFKLDYRDETRLVVWLGGDLIKGIIHDPQSGLALADQVADAVWLLRQALTILAGKFKDVEVYCSTGNHDRNVSRHQERATSGKWDSFATHIYIGVKAGVAHIPNIRVHIPRTPHIEYHPFPHQRVYATHGDTCLNPGNPGKSINISRLETQMAKLNNDQVAANEKPFGLFVVGHVHTGSLTHLATGSLITNGCVIPPDPYSYSVGYTATKNGQYLWETTHSRLVGDSRFLDVDESVDKDASLDKLIVPWGGDF